MKRIIKRGHIFHDIEHIIQELNLLEYLLKHDERRLSINIAQFSPLSMKNTKCYKIKIT